MTMVQKSTNPSATRPRLSIAEKFDIIPAIFSILSAGFFALLTGLNRGEIGAPTFFLHVAYAILRKATTRLSVLQFQSLSPPTDQLYEKYARSLGNTPQTVALECGGKGHWIGDRHATYVLVWYHGGGFCLPANMGYFKFCERLVASHHVKDLTIFFLEYTLAPHAQYPTQIVQAVDALRYIVTQAHRRPGHVILGGDSAGGNLALGVLSHLAHQHPAVAKLDISEPLGGLALLSPWTSLDYQPPDNLDCRGDIITPLVAGPWSRAYLGHANRDHYTDPSTAPSTWFRDFPVRKALILAGQNEIMLRDIKVFVENFVAGFSRVDFFIGKRESHVAPIYNVYVGDNKETEQGRKLVEWLHETL
ncbi:hypothetical protein ABOM_007794 [Aspergillus bombycis]|uniref:Alpha/beta hydrolase fold-3 domain-containing protein n=1 Tax=Aspergillus bombycis TaxID=109264 RepID=A0A1F7ZX76_9EURO|nr:hypothetical protein ABOM_007794 [Aspergillus bombycis]OGM44054.1 hypothetical protein ABOM_007794 [Aspergillus bombycis]